MARKIKTPVKAGLLAVLATTLLPVNAGAGCRTAPEGAGKPLATAGPAVIRGAQTPDGLIAGVDDSRNYLYVDGTTSGVTAWSRVEAGDYALIVGVGANSNSSYCGDVKRVTPRG